MSGRRDYLNTTTGKNQRAGSNALRRLARLLGRAAAQSAINTSERAKTHDDKNDEEDQDSDK